MRKLVLCHPHAALRESLAHLLGNSGYTVLIASTTDEALDMCREYAPKLVVTSLARHIGKEGNDYLVSVLRREYPKMPIVTLSGDPAEDILEYALSLGATRHFRTPIEFPTLLDGIGELAI